MRRLRSYSLFLIALILTTLCAITTHAEEAVIVHFPDKNLEAAVRKAINKPEGDILQTDLVGTGFTELRVIDAGIADLTGIEYCTDLTDLYLGRNHRKIQDVDSHHHENQISDISALARLTNLEILNLERNQIGDISALAGLTHLEELILRI